jgi:DsbC/DsbD-like thiol-disulfide interchange protein/cytochrome c biogenesis protein CcdA
MFCSALHRQVAYLWQAALALAFCAMPALVQPALAQPANHIAAQLIAEHPAAPGATVTLALLFQPATGYHGYWQNPGDAGFATNLAWTGPGKAGSPRYPVPETLMVGGLMNHVFKGEYALLIPYTLPVDAKPGAVLPIGLAADWLACTETMCVPESAKLSTTITVADGAQSPSPRFDAWRARLPAPLGATAHVALADGALRLAIPFPAKSALEHPHFFAATPDIAAYAPAQSFARKGDLLLVTLKPAQGAKLGDLAGVLRLNDAGDGVEIAATPGPVPTGGDPVASDEAPALPALPWLVLAAIAGGLLLNIMPCVFPILSLKALALARAGESQAEARAEGLFYSAGVITACALLGALLLALRAGGEQVGWAFQLQEPGVVAALLLLALGITANLLGLFEFSIPGFASRGAGASRSAFATGLLAAFVATPCTGPFMASAMGAALLLPVPSAMLLFVALGLGIALPFLAIAYVPALRRLLPRPGAWMNGFRRIMAVPMALTTLALLWLASRLGGTHFAGFCLVLAIVLIAILAMVGDAQRKGLSRARLAGAMLVAMAACAAIILPHTLQAPGDEEADLLGAQAYSEAALGAALATGHPVFAYFTADWCLTCKVNERTSIEREETRAAFAKAGVRVIKGDWTRRDPAITRYLSSQGAAGVPLYVWYRAGDKTGQKLPQVLTEKTLTNLAR